MDESVATQTKSEPLVGRTVALYGTGNGVTGTIEAVTADEAVVVYWGTINGERYTSIEVLGDPRSRCRLLPR